MFLGVLVFVVGMASLGAEIAGVRLLAPYFGASTVVWANTIGVVLVALSIGYWLGGRAADRRPRIEPLCFVALGAAVLLAIVPFAAHPLLDAGVEALDAVSAGAFVGSLLAVLVLIALPVLLLGMVAPWALRLAVVTVDEAGTVAGRLYALSTAGSLFGTLISALVLIPAVGTRRTFLAFAICLAVVAVLGIRSHRRVAAVPVLIVALFALPTDTIKPAKNGRVIYEKETEYQYARVIERAGGERRLELNEGHAVHSLYRPGTVLTNDYWDAMLFDSGEPRSVAILGNAAGTTARAFDKLRPATRIDAVEIDPELTKIGRRWFGLPRSIRVHHEDARPFLRRHDDGRWDAILVDAYRQPYIPFYLVTKEFFELARDRLTPGGRVVVNVGHPNGNDALEKAMTATMHSVFADVRRDPAMPTNTVLVAGAKLDGGRLLPGLPGGETYTDDRAPVEWLIDRSLVEYAATP
ncbi:MAG TPA: fused MFS/spermidine synthase [Thermoleophilaceae bacterium]